MIREDKFLISRRPYAVDLSSWKNPWHPSQWNGEPPPGSRMGYWSGSIDAVWFRRRQGVTMACYGNLWDFQNEEAADVHAWLAAHQDGRYGGNAVGRWDGSGYWGSQVTLEEQNEQLAILRPMLANFPEIPDGHDGWWRF